MLSRRIFLSTSLALCAALVPMAQPLSCLDCQSGPGSGTWELPSGSGKSDGFITGTLYLAPANTYRFSFDATLTDVPTPCLSCITGTIAGTLDDGFGPAPDYIVKGSYSGTFASGKGTFTCDIRTVSTDQTVGKIEGTFSDPPSSATPGTFKADWKICQ
jgi:hypothetical protein